MTTTQATARPVMLGISDEVLTCECCGKSNLKRTIVLSLDGESDAVYFGSTCGARALQGLGYSVKGPALERQAEAVARLTDSVARGAADLARLQGHG